MAHLNVVPPPCGESLRFRIDPAVPTSWAHIYHCTPGHELVYRLYGRRGDLLYVGITWSARARWEKHRAKRPWWPQVRSAVVTCYASDRDALTAELAAIHAEAPKHNVRGVRRAHPVH